MLGAEAETAGAGVRVSDETGDEAKLDSGTVDTGAKQVADAEH